MRKKLIVFLTLFVALGVLISLVADEVDQHFKQGIDYTNKGEYDKAIKEFTQVITKDKNYSEAYLGLGIVYIHKGMDKEAVELLKKAIELDPNKKMAYFILARVYEKLEDDKNAIQTWEKFIALNPEEKYLKIAEKHLERLESKR
ncbi:MAG: tetratricopeptide repeat protein [Endomicrobiia bacterium]